MKFEFRNKDSLFATPLQRLGAYLVDGLIITIMFFSIGSFVPIEYLDLNIYNEEAVIKEGITSYEKKLNMEKLSKVQNYYLILEVLYFMLLLTMKKQASFGNQIFKIMVVQNQKVKLNILDVFIRCISVLINTQLFFLGSVTYFFRKDGALLQDILSKTSVIKLKKNVD
ncbi:MAG: RDD family protein [Rickettsiales bacterium]|jgi:uncharacterized RDD family membrane protein YckC|nr:RDD family protein [Rickettsiales bacterium]